MPVLTAQETAENVTTPSDQTAITEDAEAAGTQAPSKPVTAQDPFIPIDQLSVMVKPLTKAELQVEADAWFGLLRNKAKQIAIMRLGVKKTNEAMSAEDNAAAEASLEVATSAKEMAESVPDTVPPEEAATEEPATEEAAVEEAAVEETAVEEASAPMEMPAAKKNPAVATPTPVDSGTVDSGTVDSGTVDSGTVDSAVEVKDQLLIDVTKLQDERTAIADRLEVVLDSLELKGGEVDEYRQYALAVSGIDLDTTDLSATWAAVVGWLYAKEGGQRWAMNLAKFLTIMLITLLAARLIAAIVNWLFERKVRMTQLAENLISRTVKNVVLVIGFAVALTALEIDITPILAAIGATGLVVGLALQGTLSNFASGLMILINRPFDVGNVVTAGGITGVINEMNLVSTTFRTFDNQTIHVPNNEIWNNVITNITANDTRRVDLEFGIGYNDDFEQAEQIIRDVVVAHPLVLTDPKPEVVTHLLGDSSVGIACRPWSKTSDWWQVKTELTRSVKREFDRAGISIPYPQQDIHVYHANGEQGKFLESSS